MRSFPFLPAYLLGISHRCVPSLRPLDTVLTFFILSCAIIYFAIMTYIVLAVLNELRPMLFYILSAILFVLAQLAWLLLGKVICDVSKYQPLRQLLTSYAGCII